jgi:hypothetical protein
MASVHVVDPQHTATGSSGSLCEESDEGGGDPQPALTRVDSDEVEVRVAVQAVHHGNSYEVLGAFRDRNPISSPFWVRLDDHAASLDVPRGQVLEVRRLG